MITMYFTLNGMKKLKPKLKLAQTRIASSRNLNAKICSHRSGDVVADMDSRRQVQ